MWVRTFFFETVSEPIPYNSQNEFRCVHLPRRAPNQPLPKFGRGIFPPNLAIPRNFYVLWSRKKSKNEERSEKMAEFHPLETQCKNGLGEMNKRSRIPHPELLMANIEKVQRRHFGILCYWCFRTCTIPTIENFQIKTE